MANFIPIGSRELAQAFHSDMDVAANEAVSELKHSLDLLHKCAMEEVAQEGEDFEKSAKQEEERAVVDIDRKMDIGEDVEDLEEVKAGDKKFLGDAYQEHVEKEPDVFEGPLEQKLTEKMKKTRLGEESSVEGVALATPPLSSAPSSPRKKRGFPRFVCIPRYR